jgi:hypothetical protein
MRYFMSRVRYLIATAAAFTIVAGFALNHDDLKIIGIILTVLCLALVLLGIISDKVE